LVPIRYRSGGTSFSPTWCNGRSITTETSAMPATIIDPEDEVRAMLYLLADVGGMEALHKLVAYAMAVMPADVVRDAIGGMVCHLGDFPVIGRA
jgi:hypothetical protein